MATSEQPSEYVVTRMIEGLQGKLASRPRPVAAGSMPFQMTSTSTRPSIPKACTLRPEMLPPHSATFTVSPMDRVSRARLAVRTLA